MRSRISYAGSLYPITSRALPSSCTLREPLPSTSIYNTTHSYNLQSITQFLYTERAITFYVYLQHPSNSLTTCISFIAAYIYRSVMISIDLSETAHFAHWKSETMYKTIFFDKIYYLTKNLFLGFCLRLNFFVSDWILSSTVFCLWTGACLGLNFVLDYIPQLYFVCNHLM